MTLPTQSYRLLELTQGQFAIVDEADFAWLSQWKWCAIWSKHGRTYYAARGEYIDGKHFTVRMHRQILGLDHGDPRLADHINGNTLDNRRANLRPASASQNSANQKLRNTNTTGRKGIYFEGGRWRARICHNRKLIHLGCFSDADSAYTAYCEAAQKLRGEFARSEAV